MARDRLCEGFAKQLILDAQAGRHVDALIQGYVYRFLGRRDGRQRARRDTAGQPVDKTSQLVGRQRPVDVSPGLGRRGVDVHAAQDHFQGPATTDQPRQALRATATRNDPHRHLRMAQDRRPERRVAQVERHREFTAAAAAYTLDNRDRGLRQRPESLGHVVKKRQLRVQPGVLAGGEGRQVLYQRDVGVCDEEFRIGRVDDQHPHLVIDRDLAQQAVDLGQQRNIQQVDRRMVDRGPANAVPHARHE